MARTPIADSLRRLFSEHLAARRTGLPLDVIRECRSAQADQRHAHGISRRDFLIGSAAAALTAPLPRPAVSATAAPRIAIVGGGIAGLACALQLADQGVAATVYEAAGRVGGRMFSNNTGYWDQGQISEWGGELIDTDHRTIRRLAKRFRLRLDDVLAAEPAGAEDTYYFNGDYYTRTDADRDFAEILDAVIADVKSAPFPTTYDSFTPAGQQLDRMTIRQWIGSRVPGGNSSPLGRLLGNAYAPELGADIEDQSALNLLYLLGFQPDQTGFSIFGVSDERFHIRGGNEQLPRAIADAIGPGDALKLGYQLSRIQQTAGGRYRLAFDLMNGGSEDITADLVVLALPFAVLRRLDFKDAGFDPLKQRAIAELGRGRNAKLQLQFDSRVWNKTGPWPGISNGSSYADTGYQSTWEVTRGQAGSSGILNHFSGGSVAAAMAATTAFATSRNPSILQDATQVLKQSAPVFPGFDKHWNGKATLSLPHLSRFFRSSYAYYRPGQYTSFGGYEKRRQSGVFFCGEHTSTNFQGYMEGGASEGERVARVITKLLA
ncbi:MAG: FAD-dependent oxidoreductase [Methylotetracoccus sp.]